MVNDTVDLLEIKIQEAKASLPTETVNAIAVVDWKTAILSLRSKYGYTFEQLGDLELETELLLCGLTSAENYPKELMNRIKISETATNELVNEMNNLVFKKIREELIKNTERKKMLKAILFSILFLLPTSYLFSQDNPVPVPGPSVQFFHGQPVPPIFFTLNQGIPEKFRPSMII